MGGIDDATGIPNRATFSDQEDAAGDLVVLCDTVRHRGVPDAWYRDRPLHLRDPGEGAPQLEEHLADTRRPTQSERAASNAPGTRLGQWFLGQVPGIPKRRISPTRGREWLPACSPD